MRGSLIRVFVGWDVRQPISYHTLSHSILTRSSAPVSITPLVLETLPLKRQGLTPFTYSRFLVPYLCGYEGWALFLDVDMLVLDDIAKLFALADPNYAVMVSKNKIKFEWASAMLFNCEHCQILTPEYIETAEKLHGIQWAKPEEIGELPGEWNHLVGYDEPRDDVKLAHYTQGIPAFPETVDCDMSAEWNADAQQACSTALWATLMGGSVHAAPVYERLKANGHISAAH